MVFVDRKHYMKAFIKKIVPDKHWYNWRNFTNYILVNLQGALSFYKKNVKTHYCPICKTYSFKFNDYGDIPRINALCPMCRSLERDRFAWLFLNYKTDQ